MKQIKVKTHDFGVEIIQKPSHDDFAEYRLQLRLPTSVKTVKALKLEGKVVIVIWHEM